MNDLEQRIRDLPRPVPSDALDERIAALFAPTRVPPRPDKPVFKILLATALAAGLAGFAAGVGTGHWLTTPPIEPTVAGPAAERHDESPEGATTLVRLTDARISAGLDFSQSLEPFRVEPVEQEGS